MRPEFDVVSRKWSRPRPMWIAAAAAMLLVVAVSVVRHRAASPPPQVAFSDLLRDADLGVVAQLTVTGDQLDITRTDGAVVRTMAPANYVTANPTFIPDLAKKRVRIDVRPPSEATAYNYGGR